MDQRHTTDQSEECTTIETTIGDLIEAVTDIALQAGRTEQEGYRLASLTVEKLLRERTRKEFPS